MSSPKCKLLGAFLTRMTIVFCSRKNSLDMSLGSTSPGKRILRSNLLTGRSVELICFRRMAGSGGTWPVMMRLRPSRDREIMVEGMALKMTR